MIAIIKRALKDRRFIILVYGLGAMVFLWIYIVTYISFSKSMNFAELTKVMPEAMMKAFNIDLNTFNTLDGFLSTDPFAFLWPILMLFMVISSAGGSIAGEIEKGTMELLLSLPVSRLKIYFAKYFSNLIGLVVFIILSVLTAIPIAKLHGQSVSSPHILLMALLGLIFGLAILGLGMFFSSLFNEKGKVYFATSGILIVMYVLNILASLKDSINDLKYASFFYYYNPAKALQYGEIDKYAFLVFIGVAVVFTVAGAIIFNKKDISSRV